MKTHIEIQAQAILRYKFKGKKGNRRKVLQFIEGSNSAHQVIYTFQNISQLNQFFIERKEVNIWKIKDQRHRHHPQEIYMRVNFWGEVVTYTSKQDLYQEISRDSEEEGKFEIHNISHNSNNTQKTFVQYESGWFSKQFTEYDSEIEFQQAINDEEGDKEDDESLFNQIFWGVMSGLVFLGGGYKSYSLLQSVNNTTNSNDDNNISNNPFELINQQNNYWDVLNPDFNQNIPCLVGLTLGAAGSSATNNPLPLILAGMNCLSSHVASASAFPAVLELSDLDGTNGLKINGEAAGDQGGFSVGTVGDVNGDSISDFIVTAVNADPHEKAGAGSSYVVFGHKEEWVIPLEFSTLDGTNGFKINGEVANDKSGLSISNVGDINGDNIDDFVVSAPLASASEKYQVGSSYIIFGHHGTWTTPLELSMLNGTNGFKINGEAIGGQSGFSVSITAGDINGDGVPDLVIGAYLASPNGKNNAGSSYVVFGHKGEWATPLELSTLDGINGFKINGEVAGDNSGFAVSNAGDINGDGVSDVIIGANKASPNGKTQAGSSYVIFGHSGAWTTPLELSTLNGTNGFKINGEAPGDRSGFSVNMAGDINEDSSTDLILGAFGADPHGKDSAGSSYIIFGHREVWTTPFELSTLDGTNGFKINGEVAGDLSGLLVNTAGDINGDGISDVIIGANGADPDGRLEAGSSYVVFGYRGVRVTPLELSTLNGINGFKINGEVAGDQSGFSASHAGDVNGDGVDDLIIGADYASPNGKTGAGSSYVIFGRKEDASSSTFPYAIVFGGGAGGLIALAIMYHCYRKKNREQIAAQQTMQKAMQYEESSVVESPKTMRGIKMDELSNASVSTIFEPCDRPSFLEANRDGHYAEAPSSASDTHHSKHRGEAPSLVDDYSFADPAPAP